MTKHWRRRAYVAATIAAGSLLAALATPGPIVVGKWVWAIH
jgi:hypothetical protein